MILQFRQRWNIVLVLLDREKKLFKSTLQRKQKLSHDNFVAFYHLKAKDFEIKPYALYFGNFANVSKVDNMEKPDYIIHANFCIDYSTIDNKDIVDIQSYLMKQHKIKQCSD